MILSDFCDSHKCIDVTSHSHSSLHVGIHVRLKGGKAAHMCIIAAVPHVQM